MLFVSPEFTTAVVVLSIQMLYFSSSSGNLEIVGIDFSKGISFISSEGVEVVSFYLNYND